MSILFSIVRYIQSQLQSSSISCDLDVDKIWFTEAQNEFMLLANFLAWFLGIENSCLLYSRKSRPWIQQIWLWLNACVVFIWRVGEIDSKSDHKIAFNHLFNVTSRCCFDLQNIQLGWIAVVQLGYHVYCQAEVKYLKLVQEQSLTWLLKPKEFKLVQEACSKAQACLTFRPLTPSDVLSVLLHLMGRQRKKAILDPCV